MFSSFNLSALSPCLLLPKPPVLHCLSSFSSHPLEYWQVFSVIFPLIHDTCTSDCTQTCRHTQTHPPWCITAEWCSEAAVPLFPYLWLCHCAREATELKNFNWHLGKLMHTVLTHTQTHTIGSTSSWRILHSLVLISFQLFLRASIESLNLYYIHIIYRCLHPKI